MRSIVLALKHGKSDSTIFSFGVVGTYFHLKPDYPLSQKYETALLHEVILAPHSFGAIRAITQGLWLSLHHSHPLPELVKLC